MLASFGRLTQICHIVNDPAYLCIYFHSEINWHISGKITNLNQASIERRNSGQVLRNLCTEDAVCNFVTEGFGFP
jgi:hypothetical protein